MAKFVINGDSTFEIARALIPVIIPFEVERELITCESCDYFVKPKDFPDHPYCKGRLFGIKVNEEFFCGDAIKKKDEY